MIKKCVIPVAGIGSRMLPITKVVPKEVLPIVDLPAIYFGVSEAKNSGIEDIIFITSTAKSPILDFFDYSHLEEKYEDKLKEFSKLINIISVRQKSPRGLGDAIGYAETLISEDYFFVLLPDDLIFSEKPVMLQMLEAFEKRPGIYISMMEVPEDSVSSYGIAKGKLITKTIIEIEDLIEKPKKETAPSRWAIIVRYILPKEIFKKIKNTPPGKKGEIQLTDAIRSFRGEIPIYGYLFEGKRFDVGNKAGFIKANLFYSLKRADIKDEIRDFIKEIFDAL